MSDAAEVMFEAEVRCEAIIYIPGIASSDDSFPDVFTDEFCDWLPETDHKPLYTALPRLKRFAEGEDAPEPEAVWDALLGTPGFLVQAATPRRTHPEGKSYFYSSWGNYYTEWLYAATEADIARVCCEWAEERHTADATEAEAA